MQETAEWKRNLFIIWASQFLSVTGFFFALPFAPYYIQELGVTDPDRLKLYVALFGAAAPLSLAVFAPVWGGLADRYGRRIMLLRANFGAAVVLVLMGRVASAETLVVLRLVQGMVTGTVPAAQAMVAADAPEEKSGFALGGLTAVLFSGTMAGSFFGGMFAEFFGYRAAYYASGGLLVAAGLLVMVGTRENFVRKTGTEPVSARLRSRLLPNPGPAWPLFMVIAMLAFSRHFDLPFLPLLVQEIHGRVEGAAFWTGAANAAAGLAGLVSGIFLGRLADRFNPGSIARLSSLGAALLILPHALAQGFGVLLPVRFGAIFCSGGMEPVFQAWLSKITPRENRATVFGWAASARFLGWTLAPLISGLVASGLGLRAIYFVAAFMFLLLIPSIGRVGRKLEHLNQATKNR